MGCSGKMPGWTTRVANLGKAVAKWGLAGFPTVTDAVYRQRLDQCQSCELLVDDTKCSHPQCGSYVARKASLATEKCPIGKWMVETGENVVAPAAKTEKPKRTPKPRPVTEKKEPASCTHYPRVHMGYDAAKQSVTLTISCQRCGVAMLLDGEQTAAHSVSISLASTSASERGS